MSAPSNVLPSLHPLKPHDSVMLEPELMDGGDSPHSGATGGGGAGFMAMWERGGGPGSATHLHSNLMAVPSRQLSASVSGTPPQGAAPPAARRGSQTGRPASAGVRLAATSSASQHQLYMPSRASLEAASASAAPAVGASYHPSPAQSRRGSVDLGLRPALKSARLEDAMLAAPSLLPPAASLSVPAAEAPPLLLGQATLAAADAQRAERLELYAALLATVRPALQWQSAVHKWQVKAWKQLGGMLRQNAELLARVTGQPHAAPEPPPR